MSWTRRSNLEIMGEILDLKSAGKTKIMYSVNLSFEQTAKYLDFLESNGLIKKLERNGRFTYGTTAKGVNLMERIRGLVEELGLKERLDEI